MEELNAEIRFSEDGVQHNGELINDKKIGSILKTMFQKSYKLWCNTQLHGKVISKCIDNGISVQNHSTGWRQPDYEEKLLQLCLLFRNSNANSNANTSNKKENLEE